MTGAPAAFARRFSATIFGTTRRVCRSSASAPSKSNALTMSMIRSAVLDTPPAYVLRCNWAVTSSAAHCETQLPLSCERCADARDDIIPVAAAALTEEPHRRIPRRIVALLHPAPVARRRQQRPDRHAERAGEGRSHRIDRDHNIKPGTLSR